jgi:uncharacterized membrane-anchored protein YitT (DUF2179 family)
MPLRKKIGPFIKSQAIITFGLLLYALAWTTFLMPYKITGGGISGLAALLFYATGIPIGVPFLLLNAVLILLAFRILGRAFVLKSIYGIAVLAFFLQLFQSLIHNPIVNDQFMSSIIGGILAGIGIGIVFTEGGSTGGTDIIAMMINKYKNISPGRLILYCDVIIISSSFLLFHSLEMMVYGFVTLVISAYTIDYVLSGASQSYQVFVFSRNYEQIADRIATELNRGITLIDGQGWYSKEPSKVLMILLRKNESSLLLRIVKQEDPNAFISMGSVMGVYGRGFDKLKT